MKKFVTLLLAMLLCVAIIPACDKGSDNVYSVYCPDGAPAMSLVSVLTDEDNEAFDVNVVSASTIQAYVTGEEPKADFAIMPVNAASKLLGNGEVYQMLGVVTHGNLFLLKKQNGVDITVDNLDVLIGKTVGVINLANVPGLTFKAILSDNNIPYANLSETGEVDATKVNLKGLADGTAVVPASDCDYFVVPEPAASTKVSKTAGKLLFAGNLQTLYGEEGGYPQAVAVAKKSVIESDPDKVQDFMTALTTSGNMLKDGSISVEDVVNAVKSGFISDDMAPTFTAENLTATVIANCGISFVKASQAKAEVLSYIQKLNSISNGAWGTPSDGFFVA